MRTAFVGERENGNAAILEVKLPKMVEDGEARHDVAAAQLLDAAVLAQAKQPYQRPTASPVAAGFTLPYHQAHAQGEEISGWTTTR